MKKFVVGIALLISMQGHVAASPVGTIIPNFTVNTNGCSDPTGSYSNTLKSACDSHDVCYGSVGNSRLACDVSFRDDGYDLCHDKWPTGAQIVQREECYLAVSIMYDAVRIGGYGNFKAAQEFSMEEIGTLAHLVLVNDQVTTPRYQERISDTLVDYLEATFLEEVGRYPTALEQFELMEPLSDYRGDGQVHLSHYEDWKGALATRISLANYSSSGADALYLLRSATDPMGNIYKVYLDADIVSKGSNLSYDWLVNNTHFSGSHFERSVSGSGMVYFNGWLKVEDVNGSIDYKYVDKQVYVEVNTGGGGMEP